MRKNLPVELGVEKKKYREPKQIKKKKKQYLLLINLRWSSNGDVLGGGWGSVERGGGKGRGRSNQEER